MELTLAFCGCQVPKFVCVVCKKEYTNLLKHTVYPPLLPTTYRYLPHTDRLLPTYSVISTDHTYYRYKTCVSSQKNSEQSAVCPKKVLCSGGYSSVDSGGYICATCRAESISHLYSKNSKVNPRLQSLLELTY